MIPPYNGFGDEEDSLGYVYRLMPIAPKKDYFKWMDNQICLRYYAKLNTKAPEDLDRRFIITFFCYDDNLLVYEPRTTKLRYILIFRSNLINHYYYQRYLSWQVP